MTAFQILLLNGFHTGLWVCIVVSAITTFCLFYNFVESKNEEDQKYFFHWFTIALATLFFLALTKAVVPATWQIHNAERCAKKGEMC